jgi:hypothetical protein
VTVLAEAVFARDIRRLMHPGTLLGGPPIGAGIWLTVGSMAGLQP